MNNGPYNCMNIEFMVIKNVLPSGKWKSSSTQFASEMTFCCQTIYNPKTILHRFNIETYIDFTLLS